MTKDLCVIPFEFSYATVALIGTFIALYAGLLGLLTYNSYKFIFKQWHLRCIELKLLYIASILSLIIRLLSLIAWLRSNIKHENGELSTFNRW